MPLKPHGVVYRIRNSVNGKVYIGITRKRLSQRWAEHRCCARGDRDGALYQAMRKYGLDAFCIEVVEQAQSEAELGAKEREWIEKCGSLSPGGYNLTAGGEDRVVLSAESRAKIAAARRGVKRTAAERAKQSASCLGRKLSAAAIEKMRAALKVRVFTPEHRARISAGLRGKPSAIRKPVIAGGVSYSCMAHAAAALGICAKVIRKRCRRGDVGYAFV